MEHQPGRQSSGMRRQLAAMACVLVALHLAGWGILFLVVLPGNYGTAVAPIGVGIGLTAYTLGMRHAFDVDHIAAIDNVTRRLAATQVGRSPSVGFFFSLGHSTVVFALAVILAVGLGAIIKPLLADGSWLRDVTSTVGGTVSGVFLLVVGTINALSLLALVRAARRPAALLAEVLPSGPLGRVLRRPLRVVGRARHMYPIGFLFGLGFDTATEIGLLVVAATGVAAGLPWYGVLCLPLLFAAGMVLFDTLDGVFVSYAYSWALAGHGRKVRYNVIVTAVSVAAALAIGGFQLAGAMSDGVDAFSRLTQASLRTP